MASLVIRDFGEAIKERLRVRAAQHGRGMEEEAREILQAALSAEAAGPANLAAAIRRRVSGAAPIEAAPLSRQKMKAPPEFD